MLKRSLLIVIALIVCSASTIPEKIIKKANKVMVKFYETETIYTETINIPKELNTATASQFGNGNLFRISADGNFLGYGYIGNAPSKAATFDYLVLFDNDLIITKSKVLVYREEYGGEIGSKRWLKQFVGVSTSSEELKYNQDIIPISGATISVRSMTHAINDLLKSIALLQQKNIL